MNIKKRLLETNNRWFERALSDPAIGIGVMTKANGTKLIWHKAKTGEIIGVEYGRPNIGHFRFTDETSFDDTSIHFRLADVPDLSWLSTKYEHSQLGPKEGILFCTDHDGINWYTTSTSLEPDDFIRLHTRPCSEHKYGRAGGVYRAILEDYGLVLHKIGHRFENRVRLVDPDVMPELLDKPYALVKGAGTAVKVLEHIDDAVANYHQYALTLNLQDLVKPDQVYNVNALLAMVIKENFTDEHSVQFDLGEMLFEYQGDLLSLAILLQRHPGKFYFTPAHNGHHELIVNSRGKIPLSPLG